MRTVHFVLALWMVVNVAVSQSTSDAGAPFPRFTIAPGRVDGDGLPVSGARLCVLGKASECFEMPLHLSGSESKVVYQFGLEPLAERWSVPGGGSWVFFSSLFSGGGSGTLRRLAVLRYDEGKIRNLLPWTGVTNQSDFAMWTLPEVSGYPVLVEADFYWDFDAGETHLSDHRFDVEAWVYEPAEDVYVRRVTYRTEKKYEGLDKVERVHVVQPEREEILRRLGVRSGSSAK